MQKCIIFTEKNKMLQTDLYALENKIKSLRNQLRGVSSSETSKAARPQKNWHEINSDRTKRRRLSSFKDLLLETLKKMKVCHRAEVSLWLEKNKIAFSFTPCDLRRNESNNKCVNSNGKNVYSNHTYSRREQDYSENDTFDDMEYSDIYDCCGEWRRKHIRKIIYVMDCFRVSHEAYHELRMVSKGHLPPIGRISNEKKFMSEEIPYEKHPKVSMCLKIISIWINVCERLVYWYFFPGRCNPMTCF